jgi:hypothetical protein
VKFWAGSELCGESPYFDEPMNAMRVGLMVSLFVAVRLFAQVVPTIGPDLPGGGTSAPSNDTQNTTPPDQPGIEPVEEVLSDTGYFVASRGPHERTWQRIVEVQGEDGFLQARTNSYVEIGTSMHAWSEEKREWVQASDEIDILEEGAIARKSQHQVAFAGNINDPNGTIDLLTPDGKHLRSRVIGLAYTDGEQSVFIGETKDTQGLVFGRNQVLYIGAFDAIQADVRYTTTRASFEQDIILREQLASPVDFQMSPATVKLEVWSEFFDPPEPAKCARVRDRGRNIRGSRDEAVDRRRHRGVASGAFA